MKNVFSFIIIGLLITTTLFGQKTKQQSLELKIRPPELASSTLNIGLEYLPNERIGIEINTGINAGNSSILSYYQNQVSETDFYTLLQGRFYISPRYGGDRFYVGIYGLYEYERNNASLFPKAVENRAVLGGMVGYKLLIMSRGSVDLGFGTGFGKKQTKRETFSGDPAIIQSGLLRFYSLICLSVGYRFYLN